MTRVVCRHDEWQLEVMPALGGAISHLSWDGTDILRPMPEEAAVNAGGSFALVPYSNRIAYGQFHWLGKRYQLARNFGSHPHSLHGCGWQMPWHITQQGQASITLGLTHDAKGARAKAWPFAFRAEQHFTLSAQSLAITLSVENLTDHEVPMGLGFHPYFARASESEVRLHAQGVQINGENALPRELCAIPAAWDLTAWRTPVPELMDNCFTQWNGHAQVRWPKQRLQVDLHAPAAAHAVVFMPPAARDFVAIEPVTHINDALNNAGMGQANWPMPTLAARASTQLSMRLEVSRYA
ncbi:MAG: aldose 1-epimerase [Aeromonas sp.]